MRKPLLFFALILIISGAYACIGPGISCAKGAIEIKIPVNLDVLKANYPEVKNCRAFYESFSGIKPEGVFYSTTPGVILAAGKNGIILQIAVKKYSPGPDPYSFVNETCIFYNVSSWVWEHPKEVLRKELNNLRRIGALQLSNEDLDQIVKLAQWGIAGNQWISYGCHGFIIDAVKSCGYSPIVIEHPEFEGMPLLPVMSDLLIVFSVIFGLFVSLRFLRNAG